MKKYFLMLCCLGALGICSGCASSTGVMPWGKGFYSVSVAQDKTLFTSMNDAERKAYEEASAYCGAMGKQVEIDAYSRSSTYWHYNTKLIFRCIPRTSSEEVSQDDPKVKML